MKKVRTVVQDPERAHLADVRSHLVGHLKAGATLFEAEAHARRIVGNKPKKQVGDVWSVSVGDLSCPLGRPNCRNCGDPDFFDACKAAGHCPQCGRGSHLGAAFDYKTGGHGTAPDSALLAHGLIAEVFDED